MSLDQRDRNNARKNISLHFEDVSSIAAAYKYVNDVENLPGRFLRKSRQFISYRFDIP